MSAHPQKIVSSSIPKYHQLLMILREQVLSGVFSPGERLPSEEHLIRQYGLSRGTIRRAIAQLENEGLIETEHGVGSFVRRAPPNAIPFHFDPPFPASWQERLSVQVLVQERIPAPVEVQDRLHLPLSAQVFHIVRRQLLDGRCVSYSERYLPESLLPGLLQADLAQVPFLHREIVERSELPLLRAELTIEAHRLGDDEAALLSARPGQAAVVIERLTFTAPNQPAVLYRGLYLDEYTLLVRPTE